MSYVYEVEKAALLTDTGLKSLLKVRDFCQEAFDLAGAVTAGKAMNRAMGMGDSWGMMACVDRLVELGELIEVTPENDRPWQNRVFVAPWRE